VLADEYDNVLDGAIAAGALQGGGRRIAVCSVIEEASKPKASTPTSLQ
jgi:hypothetical protein